MIAAPVMKELIRCVLREKQIQFLYQGHVTHSLKANNP